MSVSRKKQFEVIKASKRSRDIKGLIVGRDGKRLKFGKSGGMILHDEGLAKEVDEKYGRGGQGDVVVVEIDDADRSAENRGGRRTRKTWSVPDLPWK